jgi:hypothetical protein
MVPKVPNTGSVVVTSGRPIDPAHTGRLGDTKVKLSTAVTMSFWNFIFMMSCSFLKGLKNAVDGNVRTLRS